MLTGLRRTVLLVMALLLVVATAAGTADARSPKAKPAKAKKQPVVYVFKGEIAEVGGDSVTVSVEKGNKFARSFAGDQVEFAVSESTKVVKDDIRVSPAELAAGDEVVVRSRAERGAASFTANIIVAQTPGAAEEEEPEGPAA